MCADIRLPFVLAFFLVCSTVNGHGQPVNVNIDHDTIIATNGAKDPAGYSPMIYYDGSEDAELDHVQLPTGDRVALSNLPGFDIANMAPGSGLYLDVIPRRDYMSQAQDLRWLWYWGGAEGSVTIAPNDESLWIASETGDVTLFQNDPPVVSSLRIAEPSGDELGLHVHFLRYLLDDEPTAAQGAYGFFAQLSSSNYASSEPILVVLNNGLSASLLLRAAYDINAAAVLHGDFDDDGLLTVSDLDLLDEQIRSDSPDTTFDVDDNGSVDEADLSYWIVQLNNTWMGDADLDGEFNSNDLVSVLAAGQYESGMVGNASWDSGDWNADGDFTSEDLVVALTDGGYERGPRTDTKAVPEPNSVAALIVGGLAILYIRGPTAYSRNNVSNFGTDS